MPLFWISLAFLAGIVLGEWAGLPSLIWVVLAASALGLMGLQWYLARNHAGNQRILRHLAAWRLRLRQCSPIYPQIQVRKLRDLHLLLTSKFGFPKPVAVLLCFVFLGALRYQLACLPPGPGFIAFYNDTQTDMAVVGVVVEPPDVRDRYVNLRVEVERVRPADDLHHMQVAGMLLARVPPGDDWQYGDRLVLQGGLETPPEGEDFSYRDYLARQGVYAYMPEGNAARIEAGQGNPLLSAIYSLKARALDIVYQIFPDPEASLMKETTQLELK